MHLKGRRGHQSSLNKYVVAAPQQPAENLTTKNKDKVYSSYNY